MTRTLAALALVTATVPALAGDPKKPKAPRPQPAAAPTTAAAAQVAVVAPAPAVTTVAVEPPAAEASPDEAPNRPGFSAGALVGISSTGFGFGLGARAGYTLPFHLYLGGDIEDFFGGSLQLFSVGPEVGYDLALPAGGLPFLLRPYVGFGLAHVSELGVSDAFLLSVYPGVEFLYDVVPHVFVGLDVRVPFFTTGQATAIFSGFVTAGYKM